MKGGQAAGKCPVSGKQDGVCPRSVDASSKVGNRVFVIGVGMTKFIKPGRPENPDYHILSKQAVNRAMRDANITYDKVQAACVGYVYGDSCCG